MTKDETLRLALDTLKEVREETFRLMRNGERLYLEDKVWSTIISIQEALETKDEPVAWCDPKEIWQLKNGRGHFIVMPEKNYVYSKPLYTHPQPKLETKDEPVAWGMGKDGVILDVICPAEHTREEGGYTTPLYTHPKEWVGLKDDDEIPWDGVDAKSFARAIKSKLKE